MGGLGENGFEVGVESSQIRRDMPWRNELKKMITERLRQLEVQGLMTREVMDTAPVSVQYQITELGCTALGFLDELRKWSENLPKHISDV
ncbi:winged helix-turn-helix transcriptional regulator [Polycladidibacter hongkongensis]|uniref:winged helix-turn-helix transcriptional regulator n=1 Tax=Polycladidibacter hongkongensis TaxID=1647556 RepID=UPI000AA88C54|nr:winged helix-turn-helix transcriptional regulator [Pseudovibrio hongkongensis]